MGQLGGMDYGVAEFIIEGITDVIGSRNPFVEELQGTMKGIFALWFVVVAA